MDTPDEGRARRRYFQLEDALCRSLTLKQMVVPISGSDED